MQFSSTEGEHRYADLVRVAPRTVVGLDVVPTGLGSSSLGSDSGLVDSQVQLLSSRTLLTTVIQKEGLEAQAGPSRASLTGSISGLLKSLLYGPNRADFEGSTPFDRALSQLQSSLKIERLGNTYVLRVTVSSGSPQRAADIANSIAATYVEQGQDAINQETRQTADALQPRRARRDFGCDDLRAGNHRLAGLLESEHGPYRAAAEHHRRTEGDDGDRRQHHGVNAAQRQDAEHDARRSGQEHDGKAAAAEILGHGRSTFRHDHGA